ncbi:MAG TPA: hypothetical protein VM093_04360 [Aeromicrobium sp.]|nr:hypothetical protein [Aeromicrobium sp.]
MRRLVIPLCLAGLLAACGLIGGKDNPPKPPPDVGSRLAAFRAVCDGKGTPTAPDYAKDDDHRVVAFEGKGDDMRIAGANRLPEDWTADFPWDDIDKVDLVVCGERVAAKPVRLCKDSGGQKDAITWHTATYSYTARSLRTGKPLGKAKTIKARSHRCPTNVSVARQYIPLDQFALISKTALRDFTKPFVQP